MASLHINRATRIAVPARLSRSLQIYRIMANDAQQKTYHKKASGSALNTVRKHTKDNELKLFGSCFWYRHFPVAYCRSPDVITDSFLAHLSSVCG